MTKRGRSHEMIAARDAGRERPDGEEGLLLAMGVSPSVDWCAPFCAGLNVPGARGRVCLLTHGRLGLSPPLKARCIARHQSSVSYAGRPQLFSWIRSYG